MRDVQLICIDKIKGILQKHLSQIAGIVKWQLHRPSRLRVSRCGRIPGNSLPPGSATLQLQFQLPVCLVIRCLRQACSGRGPCRHNRKLGWPFPRKTMCIEKCFKVRGVHCLIFARAGLRLHSASGGRESPDPACVHNQGIDIPRSPKEYINSDRLQFNLWPLVGLNQSRQNCLT